MSLGAKHQPRGPGGRLLGPERGSAGARGSRGADPGSPNQRRSPAGWALGRPAPRPRLGPRPPRFGRACAPALALALALAPGCAPAPDAPATVLLMTLDSVRRDHVSAYGRRSAFDPEARTTPNFDRLAAAGILFERAYSSTSWTLPAHATLLTGLPDQIHGATNNDRHIPAAVETLAECFAAGGYRTQGFFSGPNLHPAFGFAQGFERYQDCSGVEVPAELFAGPEQAGRDDRFLDVHVASHQVRTSPILLASIEEFLAADLGPQERCFLFVHWWDPHYDYLAPAEHVARFANPHYSGRLSGRFVQDKFGPWAPPDLEHLLALYDAEIAYTDEHVGRLLARLALLGRERDLLVALTSDHGEEFYEHGKWGHQRTLYDEVLAIPMLLSWPAAWPAGRSVAEPVQLIDLFATLLSAARLPVPAASESLDLARLFLGSDPGRRELFFHLDAPQREIRLDAVQRGRRKLIVGADGSEPSFFDLERDPRERAEARPLRPGTEAAELYQRLGQELERRRALHASAGHLEAGAGAEFGPDLRAALEAAGYLKDD